MTREDDVATVATTYAHLHADVTAALTTWVAPEATQEALRREFLDFLAAHPDGVAKAGPPAHITASCLVLDPSGEHVLLTHHRRAEAWFQFGGHLEARDAGLRAAATREAREESGVAGLTVSGDLVHLDRHALLGNFGHCREHLDIRFAAIAPLSAATAVSTESLDVRWFPAAALPERSGEELAGLIAAARAVLPRCGA